MRGRRASDTITGGVENNDISNFTIFPAPLCISNPQGGTLPQERVAVYVDGFNLFYGMRSKGWRRYYWLDLQKLAENLLRSHQRLETIRYFTASLFHDSDDAGKATRQATYLEALQTLSCLSIHHGYFQPQEIKCRKCGNVWRTYEEKMTDVNISVTLLNDAQDDLFDTAMIISADSDLVGPVEAVLQRYPEKRVIAAFPPDRKSKHLRQVANASFTIGRNKLRDSQLPDEVTRADGFVLRRPASWT